MLYITFLIEYILRVPSLEKGGAGVVCNIIGNMNSSN